jgi:hypothetical protein
MKRTPFLDVALGPQKACRPLRPIPNRVTTKTGPERISTAMRVRANEYISKPFTKEVIRDKLER